MGREWDLLEKTELRIERIGLSGANLSDVAETVAAVLGLGAREVFVIDARDELLTLDILRRSVDPRMLVGKQEALFAALAALPGITVTDQTAVCSEGILGWIAGDAAVQRELLDRSMRMIDEIEDNIAHRAIVFSTGPEVATGQIVDTNKPWITTRLTEGGFRAQAGPNLPDDTDAIAAAIREAGHELGFGLVITTGGVGAESKDGTVEALLALDPDAQTPYLFRVHRGHGRHVKDGVRIGLGRVGTALVLCLPGPHEEARIGLETLLDGMARNTPDPQLAEDIAAALWARIRGTGPGTAHPAAGEAPVESRIGG